MAGTTDEAVDDEGGKESPREAKRLSGSGELGVGRGALDKHLHVVSLVFHFEIPCPSPSTYALVVDDLDDGCKPASVGVVAVDDNDAANLNEAPVGSLNHGFTHCNGGLVNAASARKLCQNCAHNVPDELADREEGRVYVRTSCRELSV